MAGSTTSTHSALVKPEVVAEISDAVFRNSDFLPLFRQVPAMGSSHQIKVIVAANGSAQVFVEDQAVPAAGYQQVVTASASYKDIRVFYRITGHLKRQLGGTWEQPFGNGAYGGGVDIELQKAKEDLVDLCNTTFLDTGIYGIQGIIDASTAYYDLSRTTYAALKSYEKAGSAALSAALMDRLIHETYNAPYGGRIQLFLMPPAQARKLGAVVHGKLAMNGRGDVGAMPLGELPAYANIPIVEIRDLTATELLGLSDLNTAWYVAVHEAAPGGIDVLPYGVTADAQITQLCTSLALICTQPQHQGKLTTLGTT